MIELLRTTLHRIRSERGASLSMALMLMLVCTVIAGITLTAASATSGRLHQVEKTEKSYYNVTSAAKLLSDQMEEGITVTVVRQCSKATRGPSGWTVGPEATWSVSVDGKDATSPTSLSNNATVFELATCDLLFGNDAAYTESKNFKALNNRSVTGETLQRSIDFSAYKPTPADVDYTAFSYDPFKLVASGGISGGFTDVQVTVKRNEDETFYFTVTDSVSDVDTPSTYTVVAAVALSTEPNFTDSDESLTWTTTATWTYLYTIAGGGA